MAIPRFLQTGPVAVGAPILIGVFLAVRSAWVCDDAFISFRYVDHLVSGFGLVYNQGERVEGYTHFLWVILLTALRSLGFDLVTAGRYLPVVFHAATLALLANVARRQEQDRNRWFVAIAAWAVALHPDLRIWASGGLETAAFTFFVTATVLAASAAHARAGATATLAALATLSRPEGLLLTAVVGAVLILRHRSAAVAGRFAAVWLALIVPLVAWRWFYYHDWVPNTFYAKSGGLANWEQGWRYVRSYFESYPILIAALGVTVAYGARHARRIGDVVFPCALATVVIVLYVFRVGGDFMFGRFLVPVTPLLYLGLERVIRRQRRPIALVGAAITLAAMVVAPLTRARVLASGAPVQGIVDEHRVYTRALIEAKRRDGSEMAQLFHGVDARICALGSQASFAYYARFPYVFERYGLTDRDFARRSVGQRTRPGHERDISRQDLIARRIHFIFRGRAEERRGAIDEATFGPLLASVVFYDRRVMDALRGRPGAEFVDYPAYLDSLAQVASTLEPDARRRAWIVAQEYYFAHTDDAEREARLRAALVEGR